MAELELRQDENKNIIYEPVTSRRLMAIESFEDAIRLASELYGNDLIPSYSLGDGFTKGDKDDLVGVPFIVMGWGLGWSAYAMEERFSILRVVTQNNEKLRISDGGTGIHKTMMDMFDGDPVNFKSIVALGGLVKSEYTPRNPDGSHKTDGNGRPILSAVTYYFDNSKLDFTNIAR